MTVVAISQSNYIPWKGYFDLIHDVDVFVFYDDVQYTIRDWRNRNLIKTPTGTSWLSIPVGVDRNRLINQVSIIERDWQRRHWKTIQQYYKKANHYAMYEKFFESVYLDFEWKSLSELNQYLVRSISKNFLGIDTLIVNSSDIPHSGTKSHAIRSILSALDADTYISGPLAKQYINEQEYRDDGVKLVWKDYSGYPEYLQFFPPFRHDVSIIDLLFHTGPGARYYVWGWRDSKHSANQ